MMHFRSMYTHTYMSITASDEKTDEFEREQEGGKERGMIGYNKK